MTSLDWILEHIFRSENIPGFILGLLASFSANFISKGLISIPKLFAKKNQRKMELGNKWIGIICPENEGEISSYTVELVLKVKRSFEVYGTAEYLFENRVVQQELSGGFYNDDYIYIKYNNRDKSVFQHGYIILRWPNNPKILEGKYVGIGDVSNRIVSGEIKLKSMK